jgi:hypothetical protein
MRRSPWLVAVGLVVAVGCSLDRPNYREVTLPDGTVVLGHLSGRSANFFSIRLEDATPGVALRSTARLHLRNHVFVLRDLNPDGLRLLGIEVRHRDYGPADEEFAFVGYGEENRDGDIKFVFARGRLRKFYAWCRRPQQCDFVLSWPGHTQGGFRLPIAEPDLRQVVNQPLFTRDYSGK